MVTDQPKAIRLIAAQRTALICSALLFAMGALASGAEAPARLDLEVVRDEVPSTLDANSIVTVEVTLRNDGSETWSPRSDDFVSYHWLSADGSVIVRDGIRSPLPLEVPPGGETTVDAQLAVPDIGGVLRLQWDVVREHAYWVSEHDPTPASPRDVRVNRTAPSHAMTIVRSDMPHFVWAGRTIHVKLTVRNDGSESWTGDLPINVSYHWFRTDGSPLVFDGLRTPLGGPVEPGQEREVDAIVEAPGRAGRAAFQWDLVHEGVTWFGQRDPTPEPQLAIVLLPTPQPGLHGAFVAVLLCLTIVLVSKKPNAAPAIRELARVTDVSWLFLAIVFKQLVVATETHLPQSAESYVLIVGMAAAIALLTYVLPRSGRAATTWVLNAGVSLLILADLAHFRYFEDVISSASFGSARQIGDVFASFIDLLDVRDVWLFIDLVPGLVLVWSVLRMSEEPHRRRRRIVALAITATILPSLAWLTTREERDHEQVFKNAFVVRDVGLLSFHAWDVWQQLQAGAIKGRLSDKRRNDIAHWFVARERARAGTGPLFGAARGANLLMIQVESLQKFVVDYRLDGQEVTPNLNRWSRESLYFSSCVDQAAKGRTSDAELLTQTSLLPPPRGAAAFRYAGNQFTGIASILARNGYETLSAVPFDGTFWNRRVTHPKWGYQRSLFADAFTPGVVVGWGLNDRDFLAQMVPHLAFMERPFAAYLITLSNHHPFDGFPKALEELDLGAYEGTSFGNYLHAMHLFDKAFGEFMQELESAGVLDDTVVALWGDHSAGFEWSLDFARTIGVRWGDASYYLVDSVPLMIRLPGQDAPVGERTIRSGLVDVAPTLLALLGVDPAPHPFVGRNLLGDPGDLPVTQRYGSWLDDHLLYLTTGRRLDEGFCYDVTDLTVVPVERCDPGNVQAAQTMEVSRQVLRYDLQQELESELSGAR